MKPDDNIRAKCFHPTGTFVEFKREEIEQSISERFEQIVRKYPHRIAVKTKSNSLTYDQLNTAANRVAHAILTQRGEGEEPVAILLDQGAPLFITLLAVIKAGKFYAPLDASHPQSRITSILHDLQRPLIITNKKNLSLAETVAKKRTNLLDLDETELGPGAECKTLSLSPENIACILYTSGSTGQPKGVMQNHRNILHKAMVYTNCVHVCADDRLALFYSASASGSLRVIFSALLNGAMLIPFNVQQEGLAHLGIGLKQEGITIYSSSATMYRHFINTLTATDNLPALRLVHVGNETIYAHDVELYKNHFSQHCIFVANYGATEISPIRLYFVDNETQIINSTVPAGYGLDDTEVLVLNDNGEQVQTGHIGEIAVRSRYLSPGYWQREDLTREVYLSDPQRGDERIYRTGDLGRILPDGCLLNLGRKDFQVKIRGYRIEIAEIEMALLEFPSIQEAVVLAREDVSQEQTLVAYLVATNKDTPTTSELRSFLRKKLPDHMIPSVFVMVDALPLTPTGKVDRKRLAFPNRRRPKLDTPFVAPNSPLTQAVANIWSQVLGIDQVGVHDNFFDLGGHSLLATEVLSRIRQVFQLELAFISFFENPTIADLANHIEKTRATGSRSEDSCIQPVPRDRPLAISFSQRRLWFLNQLQPDSPAYNQPHALRLTGLLKTETLRKTLDAIVARHEILRSTLVSHDGTPVQVVDEIRPVELPVIDLSKHSPILRETEIQRHMREITHRPFNLGKDLMLRAALFRLRENDHILLLVIHHIASDGWSNGILFREISTFYRAFSNGAPPALPDLTIQYADFASWQRGWLQGEVLEKQLTYWKEQLKNAPPHLNITTDRPRPVVESFRSAQKRLTLPRVLNEKLKALSQREGVTLFMTLLAAFQTLLHRYTGQDDILVGSPVANRNRVEIEPLIGFFVNNLVFRGKFAGNSSFLKLLSQMREVCLGAYSHQDVPFERLVKELRPERDLRRNPLFQVMFQLRNNPNQVLKLPDLEIKELAFDSGIAKFDLHLAMADEGENLTGLLEYNTDLFNADSIERMLGHFEILLQGIVVNPNEPVRKLPLLTPAERHHQLVSWNETKKDYQTDKCIHRLFEEQAARTPDKVAVVFQEKRLTYRELNAQANQLAHYLQQLGVGPEVLVGLCVERSVEMVVGLLGILKAGGTYVPLDPTYPKERLAFMLKDAASHTLLTEERLLKQLPVIETSICLDSDWDSIITQSAANPRSQLSANNPAYLIYTSGSTGTPKGVLGLHRGVVNRLNWMWQTYPFERDEACCQKTPLSFVDSIWDIFGPLLRGIHIVIIPEDAVKDPHQLVQTLARNQVTRIVLVPSLLRMILDAFDDLKMRLPRLKYWTTSGEALPLQLCQQFLRSMPRSTLINLYGCSEASADSMYFDTKKCDSSMCVPIGRPISNTQIYLLDDSLEPVPIGVAGELHIGGAGLARGYHNRPEITAQHFLPDPFSNEAGARIYKTGDLARYLPDGNIQYLGRIDHQINIRGFRIELGEIELTLSENPGVKETVATVLESKTGDRCLVAYVVPKREASPTVSELRNFLRVKLPDYMVPSAFVFLDALPLTPNGKIDRKALPAPDPARPELHESFVAPRTPTEETLAEIWAKTLDIEKVGIHDNFFDLGGHSLLATQINTRVREAFQIEMPLRTLFESPTVAEMAPMITEHQGKKLRGKVLEQILTELESLSENEAQKRFRDSGSPLVKTE